MSDYVGGDTATISSSGAALSRTASAIVGISEPAQVAGSSAAAGVGEATASAALLRCGLAWGRLAHDLATQAEAIGRLAESTATDLDRAGS